MTWQRLIAVLLAIALAASVAAQPKADDANAGSGSAAKTSGGDTPPGNQPVVDGTDKPYPAPKFVRAKGKYVTPSGQEIETSNIAYLLDCSADMAANFQPDEGAAVTRLSALRTRLVANVKGLNPAVSFNIAAAGHARNYSDTPLGGGEEQSKKIEQWLDDAKPSGGADVLAVLKEMLTQGPDAIVIFAASLPVRPTDCAAGEDFTAWMKKQIGTWRGERKVRVDVVGYGLAEDARAFYSALAAQTGGVLTAEGKPVAQAIKPADRAGTQQPGDSAKSTDPGTQPRNAEPGSSAPSGATPDRPKKDNQ